VPPPGELDETYVSSLIEAYSLHYTITWRHPQYRNCITYRIVVRGGLSHGHFNMYRNIREICSCGFRNMRSERQSNKQTDIQTRWLQYFGSTWVSHGSAPKRHLYRFSSSCTAHRFTHVSNTHTRTQTTLRAASVAISHILCTACMRRGLKISSTSVKEWERNSQVFEGRAGTWEIMHAFSSHAHHTAMYVW